MKYIHKCASLVFCLSMMTSLAEDLRDEVAHHYVQNGDVRIHYVSIGQGPLVVMIHGFPDFWYTWRHQMAALKDSHRIVAMDLRGFNQSDQPTGVAAYSMGLLVEDVIGVIRDQDADSAIIVGHDWGGAIAWNLAMSHPKVVQKLIILNLPHPWGLARELSINPRQRANSQYARNFQEPDAHLKLTAEGLAGWVAEESVKPLYVEAFKKSSFEGMLNIYKANYPKEPYTLPQADPPKVKCPVLMIHGLDDWALLPGGLNNTWNWLENELTLVTIPGAGHFVQHDATDRVNRILVRWLKGPESSQQPKE